MNLETKDPKDMEVIIMNKPVLVIMAAGMGIRKAVVVKRLIAYNLPTI